MEEQKLYNLKKEQTMVDLQEKEDEKRRIEREEYTKNQKVKVSHCPAKKVQVSEPVDLR